MTINILEYNSDSNLEISFEDIAKEDLDLCLLANNRPEGLYDLSDKLRNESITYLDVKYKKAKLEVWNCTNWYSNLATIFLNFDKDNFIKLTKYVKIFYINIFGDLHGNKAYLNFIRNVFIDSINLYDYVNRIKKEEGFMLYFEKELRNLFQYYPDREYEVGFEIDAIYGFRGSHNIDKMDNGGELDRYNYWRKYKEKGLSKVIDKKKSNLENYKKIN